MCLWVAAVACNRGREATRGFPGRLGLEPLSAELFWGQTSCGCAAPVASNRGYPECGPLIHFGVVTESYWKVNTDVTMRCLGGRGRVFEAPGIGPGRRFAPSRQPANPDFTWLTLIRIAF